jgi:hypothetical protein
MKLTGITPAFELSMAEEPGDAEEAKQVLGLKPRVTPDGPGPSCGYCGRTSPPGGLEDMSQGGPAVHTCKDTKNCIADYDAKEPALLDKQYPDWKRRYAEFKASQMRARIHRELAAVRTRLQASGKTAYGWYHPDLLAKQQAELEAEDRRFQALAAEFTPPDSFFSDLAVQLAGRRTPDAMELAASDPDEGIGAPDTSGPAPFQMQPDPWAHTMRNPHHRAHTLGYMRGHNPGVVSGADALARRAVS